MCERETERQGERDSEFDRETERQRDKKSARERVCVCVMERTREGEIKRMGGE